MKKYLSLIALAGVLVACQPENLDTTFEVPNAEVTVNVSAMLTTIDLNVLTGNVESSTKDVTSEVSFSVDGVAASNGKATFSGSPAFAAKTVNVTATYKGETKSVSYAIDAVPAGAKLEVTAPAFVFVENKDNKDKLTTSVDLVASEKKDTEKVYFNGATHDHAGALWARNDSEFLLSGEVTYPKYEGTKLLATECNNETYKSLVDDAAAALDNRVKSEDVFSFTVSAYCLYTVWGEYTKQVDSYNVTVTDGVSSIIAGTFSVESISVLVKSDEMADPDGHGHYQPGHGHDAHDGHGSDANAGGGIIYAE